MPRAAGHLCPTKAWRELAVFSSPDPISVIDVAEVLEKEMPASLAA